MSWLLVRLQTRPNGLVLGSDMGMIASFCCSYVAAPALPPKASRRAAQACLASAAAATAAAALNLARSLRPAVCTKALRLANRRSVRAGKDGTVLPSRAHSAAC